MKIIGPFSALMEKLAGRHRAALLVKAEKRGDLHDILSASLAEIEQIPKKQGLRWHVDIDPQIML